MTESLEVKGFGSFEVKNEELGEVEAIVSTLNVVDKDGDVVLPGALPETSNVQISEYRHSVLLEGKPPVGKGIITVEGTKAILRGRFFMATTRGREMFHTVKELGADGQWSIGVLRSAIKTAPMTKNWSEQGARRLLAGFPPVEVSPVLVGAGEGTMTVATKHEKVVAEPNILRCGCGRVLGEAPTPMVFVGKAAELAEVTVPTPRDVRFCVKCRSFAVYLPTSCLTGKAA